MDSETEFQTLIAAYHIESERGDYGYGGDYYVSPRDIEAIASDIWLALIDAGYIITKRADAS